jgi:metal-responsive CopG/Arc/MetJ family transcriptional regulator
MAKKPADVIQCRLPVELRVQMDKIATERLISRSDVMREAVLKYLQAQKERALIDN